MNEKNKIQFEEFVDSIYDADTKDIERLVPAIISGLARFKSKRQTARFYGEGNNVLINQFELLFLSESFWYWQLLEVACGEVNDREDDRIVEIAMEKRGKELIMEGIEEEAKKYNGWKNWATWNAFNWMSSDYYIQKEAEGIEDIEKRIEFLKFSVHSLIANDEVFRNDFTQEELDSIDYNELAEGFNDD